MSDPVLLAKDVVKQRGKATILDKVSLAVAAGERVALLGHNGAGKSTLIKLIVGLIRGDGGQIRVCGAAPGSRAARAAVAYLPEAVAFHGALTGRDQLALFARLAGENTRVVGPLLDRVGLAKARDRRISTYSKGMRQRLGLAQVMLGTPRLALLDEPTSGLDPVSRHDLYTLVDDLAAQGTAVLISSHALTEVEARTDRIAILRHGQLVADDRLDRLAEAAGLPIRLKLRASDSASADRIATETGGARLNGASVEILCDPAQKMAKLQHIAGLGGAIADLDIAPPGLEELYRHYSGGNP